MTGVILTLIFFLVAAVFGTAGILGLFRFRDPLSRLHAGSLASTTAVFSIFLGLLFADPAPGFLARMLVIIVFFMISSPTATHFILHYIVRTEHEKESCHSGEESDAD